jgi:hypothetical protein
MRHWNTQSLGRATNLVFVSTCIAGLFVGILLCHVEYMESPQVRVIGVPLGVGFLVKENDRWTDFVPEAQLVSIGIDTISGILILLGPLLIIVSLLKRYFPR